MVIVRRRALDVPVLIRMEDDGVAVAVDHVLTDLTAGGESGGAEHEVAVTGPGPWCVRTGGQTSEATSQEQALAQTLAAVNLAAVTNTPRLALHAAVVSRGGRSLVLPGRSGTGKSTLTACLLRLGWSYVSDEALALDWSTGELVGYPRPLALSPWSQRAAGAANGLRSEGEELFRARDLAAEVDPRPGPVRHVVLLARSADVSLEVADRNDALVELLSRGFTHRHDGGRALVLLADLLRGADVWRLRLGDPRDAAALLTEACGHA